MSTLKKKYKIAFVSPRYNCHSSGGAEILCQKLAENLAQREHKITVLTTTANNPYTWANQLKEKEETINRVKIKRFNVNQSRNIELFLNIQRKIDKKESISEKEEQEWVKNSVVSSGIEKFIQQNINNYDWFIFIPYLFGTTTNNYTICREKSLLIPCLHDENFAYLKFFKKMFNDMPGIIFNSKPEKILAQKIYNIPEEKSSVVGSIVDEHRKSEEENFKKKYRINFPYLLYIGRKEGGKNIPLLLNYFRTYKDNNNNNLKLLFLGTGNLPLKFKDTNYIIDLGFIPEKDKLNAIAAATLICQPSLNESFSIVIMEAWLQKKPVLVHKDCAVTNYHCLQSNGGLYFKDYYEFEECVNYIISNSLIANLMGQNGKKYTETNYNADTILEKFETALEKFALQRSEDQFIKIS